MPLAARLANRLGRRSLEEVATARVHGNTGDVPVVRPAVEHTIMLSAPGATARKAPPRVAAKLAVPREGLQDLLVAYAVLSQLTP